MSDTQTSAGKPMCGADILVECLIRHGVEVVFAYPGGASMPIHQSLTKVEDRLRTILPRHEQGGGFMAHGYARTTGKPGVCMATSGPGATNFVTCLADEAPQVRTAAGKELGELPLLSPRGIHALVQALDDGNDDVQIAVEIENRTFFDIVG